MQLKNLRLASTFTVQPSSETSILTHFQQLNLRQREQLLKKFQLAHFIVQNNLAFMKYEQFTHGKSCCEIIIFLSNSTFRENAVKPLNEKNGTILV